MAHSALRPGRAAVVTGAASGIGLAACRRFATLGMKVCMVDIDAQALTAAHAQLLDSVAAKPADVIAIRADVANRESMQALQNSVYENFADVALLMNNAVTRTEGSCWDQYEEWRQAVDVNLWGVINGVQCFVPAMLAQGAPAVIINCGSKQGITNPPGKPAYNVCKAAVKTYSECLQHELRNRDDCQVSAHLLIPGWTTTGNKQHVQGAWLPDQVVDYLLAGLERGDFYILCPDDEVSAEMDRKRILWAAHDIVDNQPPLSRWHPDFADAFEKFSP